MQSNERIVTYSAGELGEMVRRGEDETEYAALGAMTEEEREASIDEEEGIVDADRAIAGPRSSRSESVGIDDDVHAWFKGEYDHVSLKNTILRRWMVAHPRRDEAAPPEALVPDRPKKEESA